MSYLLTNSHNSLQFHLGHNSKDNLFSPSSQKANAKETCVRYFLHEMTKPEGQMTLPLARA